MIFGAPALLKVLLIFTAVLVLNRVGIHLGLSLIAGGLFMALWFEHGISSSLEIVFKGGWNIECLFLLIVIYEILTLTLLMDKTGMMQKMIRGIRSVVPSRRVSMAMLPAMIGLLPMPGGAAVSAPMVDAADEEGMVAPLQKTVVNYWFRHSWEYWWPLYPGILLASEISGVSLKNIAIVHMPLTFVSIISGAFFLLLPLKLGPKKARPKGKIRELVFSLSPIILLLLLWFLIGHLLKSVSSSKYPPMILGLVGAILWVQFVGGADKKTWKDILVRKRTYLLLLVVVGVKVFSATLEMSNPEGVPVVEMVRHNLGDLHIPPIFVIMIIPFVSGVVTGLAFGFVGASFPIVMSLVGQGASTAQVMSYVVLAYGFGYVGMMLSPVHVCFVVTNEYFNTKMLKAYKKILGPGICVLLGALCLSYIASRFV